MKRIIFIVIAICLSFCLLSACGAEKNTNKSGSEAETTITVIVPKSAASLPVFRVLESKSFGENVGIDIQIFDSTEAMIAMASDMDYSFIVLPVHTAAVLYNNELGVKLMSVFAWGGMKLATTDTSCNSWEALEGEELHVLSKGFVPDILTQYFLSEHGLIIGETIDVVYSTYPEISQLMSLDRIKYAVDGEPYSTSNKESIENYRIIADYSAEWKSAVGDEFSLPAYGLTANGAFLSAEEDLSQRFEEEFEKAVDWMVDNPEKAGQLAETYINADGDLITNAMPNFNFSYVSAEDTKEDTEKYYEILYSYRPESIGGIIPDESFYCKNK